VNRSGLYDPTANLKPAIIRTLVDAKTADGKPLGTGSYPFNVELGAAYTNVNYATAQYFGGPAIADTGIPTREAAVLKDSLDDRVVIQTKDSLHLAQAGRYRV